jgi:hypothetical protein
MGLSYTENIIVGHLHHGLFEEMPMIFEPLTNMHILFGAKSLD